MIYLEFILNMEKLPTVGVSKSGVKGFTDARRLLFPFLKDTQVEYPALKEQFKKKWPGTKPPTSQVVLKFGRNSCLSILLMIFSTISFMHV